MSAQVVTEMEKVVQSIAHVVPDMAQVVSGIAAHVIPDMAQVVPGIALVFLDMAAVVPDIAHVVPDMAQVVAHTEKFSSTEV
jgi:hypothetical protein